jgi:hypothetical protein
MKTEIVELSRVKLNDQNPRQIKDGRFSKLVDSIISFPKMMGIRPIVVDDSYISIGGNMRCLALLSISQMSIADIVNRLNSIHGYSEKTNFEKQTLHDYWREWIAQPTAIVIRASELSEQEKHEFIIKDNVSFGEWNYNMLINDWDAEDLSDWGLDTWQDDKPNDPNEEFGRFGEFEYKNANIEAWKQLIVSFEDEKDFIEFQRITGLKLTPKTRCTYFPQKPSEPCEILYE